MTKHKLIQRILAASPMPTSEEFTLAALCGRNRYDLIWRWVAHRQKLLADAVDQLRKAHRPTAWLSRRSARWQACSYNMLARLYQPPPTPTREEYMEHQEARRVGSTLKMTIGRMGLYHGITRLQREWIEAHVRLAVSRYLGRILSRYGHPHLVDVRPMEYISPQTGVFYEARAGAANWPHWRAAMIVARYPRPAKPDKWAPPAWAVDATGCVSLWSSDHRLLDRIPLRRALVCEIRRLNRHDSSFHLLRKQLIAAQRLRNKNRRTYGRKS